MQTVLQLHERAPNTSGEQFSQAISQERRGQKQNPLTSITKTQSSKDRIGFPKAFDRKVSSLNSDNPSRYTATFPEESLPPPSVFTHENERGKYFHI